MQSRENPGCIFHCGSEAMTTTTQFHWEEIATYGDDKADRRIIPGRGGDLKRVMVKAGTVAAQHAHNFEQFFMVAQGTGILTCAEGEIPLSPGVVIHFQPNAWHHARFDTDTVLFEVNFAQPA
jgi:quercetin dioxygenase-like cupin family protein